jgi:hypothetical protein
MTWTNTNKLVETRNQRKDCFEFPTSWQCCIHGSDIIFCIFIAIFLQNYIKRQSCVNKSIQSELVYGREVPNSADRFAVIDAARALLSSEINNSFFTTRGLELNKVTMTGKNSFWTVYTFENLLKCVSSSTRYINFYRPCKGNSK